MKELSKEDFLNMLKDYPEFASEVDLFLEIKGDDLYEQVVKHIETHKWLLQEKIPIYVTFRQAIYSWYGEVYEPLKMAIDHYGVNFLLGVTKLEAFFALSDHLNYLTVEKMQKLSDPANRPSVTGCPDSERLTQCVYVNIKHVVFSYLSLFAISKFHKWRYGIKAKLFT